MKKYDLHVHSTASDGSCTPRELIDAAKKISLSGISITDHDTINAYTDDLFVYAKEQEIELIPGVEFSTVHEGEKVHILGYFFDPKSDVICRYCDRHREERKKRNLAIIEKLAAAGMVIDNEKFIEAKKSYGRPHIAEALCEKGYVKSLQEAFDRLIGDDGPYYVAQEGFSAREALEVIKEGGGKSVLAHPILLKKRSLIKKLLTLPFDGIECYYAKFSKKQNEEMVYLAEKNNLLITGGSDFHGDLKTFNTLGSAFTSEEHLRRLSDHS